MASPSLEQPCSSKARGLPTGALDRPNQIAVNVAVSGRSVVADSTATEAPPKVIVAINAELLPRKAI
jgi:hypothetical protein